MIAKVVLMILLGLAMSGAVAQNVDQTPSGAVPSTTADTQNRAPAPQFHSRTPRYELCPSDVFDIVFTYSPEFNQTVTIQPDGFVTLQEIGEMYVVGKTLPQLTHELTVAYGKLLHDPVLVLTLKDFNKPYFTVGGQVGKPGKFELRADTTVGEAITIAGGFNDSAKHSQVLLVRKISNEWAEVRKIDVKAVYKGDIREDIHLRSGDMLYVPKSKMAKLKPFLPVYGLYTTLARY